MSDDVDAVDNGNVSQPTEAEVKARELGWVPKEEYKGDPENFRDAETFLRRGEEIVGFVRKDLDKALAKNAKYEQELAEIRETMEEFRKFHNETEARAYKRAIDDLKQAKVAAYEQGDGQKVIEIEEEIDKLKEAQKPVTEEKKKPDTQVIFSPQEFNLWNKKNAWYGQNMEMSVFADELADVLLTKQPNLRGEEFLDALTKRIKKEYPEAFENPARSNTDVGGSSGVRPSEGNKKKSYDNLPADAKKACDKFVKQKLMTREQYVAEFDWDN